MCRCTRGGVEGKTTSFRIVSREFLASIIALMVCPLVNFSPMYTSKEKVTNTELLSRTDVVACVCVLYICLRGGVNTRRHICQRTVQDASHPLSPPLFGPVQGIEERGKKQSEVYGGWRRGEECSRGVPYCSSSTALWWQAGALLSPPPFAAMQTAAKVTWPH